jgi:hypothetical protein
MKLIIHQVKIPYAEMYIPIDIANRSKVAYAARPAVHPAWRGHAGYVAMHKTYCVATHVNMWRTRHFHIALY